MHKDAGDPAGQRVRLADLDPHLHCSVIGTCLSTAALRKLMGRFIDVENASDLEVHHDAVRLAAQRADVARALHKALDRQHDAAVQRFARAKDAATLQAWWDEALQAGEVPGAYWAVLTHRHLTSALRQRVFGDVHMLSHLVGAANRADIRRLVALERENAELRDRVEHLQERLVDSGSERDRLAQTLEAQAQQIVALRFAEGRHEEDQSALERGRSELDELIAAVAMQTLRREHAESALAVADAACRRFERSQTDLQERLAAVSRELAAAEAQLRERYASPQASASSPLREALAGRRVLYVGGRPSSNPAIRDLVLQHGAEYQRHDGGLEDRKGLLTAAVAWADLVAFPVDCVDHDSVLALKKACTRQGTPFLVLRTASVASFAAALCMFQADTHVRRAVAPHAACLRHA